MKEFVALLVAIFTGIMLSVYFFYTLPNDVHVVQQVKKNKVILFGNSFYGNWEVGFGSEPFVRLGCKVRNCEFTNDITKAGTADAVLFHAQQLKKELPQYTHRPHYQRWVFVMLESPERSHNTNYLKWNGFFNWTMAYRTDSDIQMYYGSAQPKKINEKAAKRNWTAVVKRRRPVAWMVSHCKTPSNREEYVRRLQKWIDVDVYGGCGNLTCNRKWKESDEDCMSLIKNEYNFYLAFENSLCKDYITEKFFKILPLDVIPVVRSGASYEPHCPRHWIVNTEDFTSPELLAKYLKSLIARPKQYAEFMKDKQNYDYKTAFGIRNHFSWCELCAKLNDPKEPTKVYDELGKWWSPSDCHTAKDL